MKQVFALKSDAQVFADKCHNWLIATDPAYAASVAKGQTVRWDFPRDEGNGTWSVTVKDRCYSALTPVEKAATVLTVKGATD